MVESKRRLFFCLQLYLEQVRKCMTWKVSWRIKKGHHLFTAIVHLMNFWFPYSVPCILINNLELMKFRFPCIHAERFSYFTFILSTLSIKWVHLFLNFAPLLVIAWSLLSKRKNESSNQSDDLFFSLQLYFDHVTFNFGWFHLVLKS